MMLNVASMTGFGRFVNGSLYSRIGIIDFTDLLLQYYITYSSIQSICYQASRRLFE